MPHLIATSRCNTQPNGPIEAGLCVAYIEAGLDQVYVLVQNTQGVWTKGTITSIPMMSLVGLPNYFIALGQDGLLYAAAFNQQGTTPQPSDWGGFQQLMNMPAGVNAPVAFNDFSAMIAYDTQYSYLVIVAVQNIAQDNDWGPTDAGFFAYTVQLSGMQQNIVTAFASGAGSWTSIAQSSITMVANYRFQSAYSPALAGTNLVPGEIQFITLVGIVGAGGNELLVGWSCTAPNFNWTAVAGSLNPGTAIIGYMSQPLPNPPPEIALIGNSGGDAIQAVVPNGGQLMAYFEPVGDGFLPWLVYGSLFPSSLGIWQNFQTVTAAFGNVDPPSGLPLLQVIGLNATVNNNDPSQQPTPRPLLVWQYIDGSWVPYNGGESLQSGFTGLVGPNPGLYPIDLAAGMGYGPEGQAFLQVPYLGSDGNVYLNYQDDSGNWYWYSGPKNQGLP